MITIGASRQLGATAASRRRRAALAVGGGMGGLDRIQKKSDGQPRAVIGLIVQFGLRTRPRPDDGLVGCSGGLYDHVPRWLVSRLDSAIVIPKGKQMQDLQELNLLIDKAKSIAGSDYALAKLLEVTPQTVSNWRYGRKPCPAADVALMAGIAGLDATAWLVRATLAKHEGTTKGDQLYKALGKALRVNGAALASSGLSALVICSVIERVKHSTMYIM